MLCHLKSCTCMEQPKPRRRAQSSSAGPAPSSNREGNWGGFWIQINSVQFCRLSHRRCSPLQDEARNDSQIRQKSLCFSSSTSRAPRNNAALKKKTVLAQGTIHNLTNRCGCEEIALKRRHPEEPEECIQRP